MGLKCFRLLRGFIRVSTPSASHSNKSCWYTGYIHQIDLTITDKGHHVYMDNFFSNPTLFEELAKETIYCCGTARGNRKGMPETLKNAKPTWTTVYDLAIPSYIWKN
jgi:hypothetical protein